jgi:hypothetical protein
MVSVVNNRLFPYIYCGIEHFPVSTIIDAWAISLYWYFINAGAVKCESIRQFVFVIGG